MTTFREDGSLYEVTGFGPVDEPGFHYELWEIDSATSGKVGVVVVPEDGSNPIINLERPVALHVLRRWLSFVPEDETLT
jgi:hypothetical protein